MKTRTKQFIRQTDHRQTHTHSHKCHTQHLSVLTRSVQSVSVRTGNAFSFPQTSFWISSKCCTFGRSRSFENVLKFVSYFLWKFKTRLNLFNKKQPLLFRTQFFLLLCCVFSLLLQCWQAHCLVNSVGNAWTD